MKIGLKIKRQIDHKKLCIKRGNDQILPMPDADGNFILDFDILLDPAYADIVEDILDACEKTKYTTRDEFFETKTPDRKKKAKGKFALIMEQTKDVEKAVDLYYKGRRGVVTRIMNFFWSL